ncbi:hypothetical protein [Burkholderia ubonensis]|uniref:hypothetical protein n=1 Tax=Burkholderia ubonensis TaxID=101571 RepID=UPI000755BB8F|nr:hypothetical protein WI75_25730 [Burkholderia ubonensis]
MTQIHDHLLDVGLRELAWFLRTRPTFRLADLETLIRSGWRSGSTSVVALRQGRFNLLQRVTQAFVLD